MFPIVGRTHKSQAPNQTSLKRSISDLNFESSSISWRMQSSRLSFSFLTPCLHVMDVIEWQRSKMHFMIIFLSFKKLLSHLNIIILGKICDDTLNVYKTSQELRTLSRLLSDCQSQTLNVMI